MDEPEQLFVFDSTPPEAMGIRKRFMYGLCLVYAVALIIGISIFSLLILPSMNTTFVVASALIGGLTLLILLIILVLLVAIVSRLPEQAPQKRGTL